MIITRTPLRITLGGGGTDLETGQGFCVAAAISLYVTIAVNHPCTDSYLLKYSTSEDVRHARDIVHPIIHDVVELLHVSPGIEIAALSDVPAGTGLGSSGAFTVGLLHALEPDATRAEIVRLACKIDTGQQDQHAAAYGGLAAYDFAAGTILPIETTLGVRLALYYTGTSREYSQQPALKLDPAQARDQADAAIEALSKTGPPTALGHCLSAQWRTKFDAAPTPFHKKMDALLKHGIANGASGGKLVGAGGGGFLLFAAGDGLRLHGAMSERGLRRVPFQIDPNGTVRIA